jgi:hypothetical protein
MLIFPKNYLVDALELFFKLGIIDAIILTCKTNLGLELKEVGLIDSSREC